MLKALYEYAERMNLTSPPGFAEKTIKAFLCLAEDGSFAGVRIDGVNPFLCPDIGSLANGTDKSNLLVEKFGAVFPEKPTAKSRFFREGLKDLSALEPLAEVCCKAMDNPQCCEEMIAALKQHKILPADRISFLVGSAYLVECDTVKTWWQSYRLQFQRPGKSDDASRCLITGELVSPLATVPKTSGLSVVGGHPSGDALICFDKPAFCSYGLKKSANAPVSEEAFAQVKAALDTLLKDAPILAGMKFVHWYDKPLPKPDEDVIRSVFGTMQEENEEEDDEEESAPEEDSAVILQAKRAADTLVGSVNSGQPAVGLPSRYFILLLSGVKGRVMVRRFTQGSYEELKANLDRWYAELRLVNRGGTDDRKPIKLTARFIALLKREKTNKKIFERLSDEIPSLSVSVVHAIIQGTPFPDAVAVRALQSIRSQMTEDSDGSDTIVPDPICCQWLKVWLIRNKKEVQLMPEYNPNHPNPAYHIGAMVAVYAALQLRAYPDVNVTVVQRFFASAQQAPALVLGRLAKMSTHHLAKLENSAAAKAYAARLAEISTRIGDSIPTVLELHEQSLFALGYYQMSAALNRERREASAKKNESSHSDKEE